ncbi:MAG TPA: HAD family phosphatase [Candidatus Babeliales bacterium]|nr:HAD family phosphatase [Candidatus Babeliales bacterium]
MKKFEAIIFDMDGTIIDTEHIWKKVTLELITNRGFEISPEEKKFLIEDLKGVALSKSCLLIKERWNLKEEVDYLIQEKTTNARNLYAQEVRFINGFQDFHAITKKFNLPTGLATNASPAIVDITNERLKLHTYFGQHMYNVSHVNYIGKPNPDIFTYTAKQLNIKPEKCLVIEDSKVGIAGAKAAQMFCIGLNSNNDRDQLINADMIVEGYHEIFLTDLLSEIK